MLGQGNRLSSPRLARRRRRMLLHKILFWTIVAVCTMAALVAVARIPAITIDTVEVSGASALSAEALRAFAAGELSGAYFFLLPKSNALLFPRRAIASGMLLAFPSLAAVDVSLDGFRSLQVTVAERAPAALWCGSAELAPSHQGGGCYFLDKSGFIFSKSPDFVGDVFLRFYGSVGATTTSPVGTKPLPPKMFETLMLFLSSLSDLTLTPVAVSVSGEGDVALYLQGGGKILFLSGSENFIEVRDNLESVLLSDEFREKSLEQLEYIDLRFGNKVYFKEKE